MHEREKDEIRHKIDVAFRAHVKKDWAAVRSHQSKGWCGFTIDAQSILQGSAAYTSETEAMLQNIELIDYEMLEIEYIFYGPICVTPYVVRLRAARRPDETLEIKVRALDVYVQEDDEWRQAASTISLPGCCEDN